MCYSFFQLLLALALRGIQCDVNFNIDLAQTDSRVCWLLHMAPFRNDSKIHDPSNWDALEPCLQPDIKDFKHPLQSDVLVPHRYLQLQSWRRSMRGRPNQVGQKRGNLSHVLPSPGTGGVFNLETGFQFTGLEEVARHGVKVYE